MSAEESDIAVIRVNGKDLSVMITGTSSAVIYAAAAALALKGGTSVYPLGKSTEEMFRDMRDAYEIQLRKDGYGSVLQEGGM